MSAKLLTVDSSLPAGIVIGASGLTALAQEVRTVQETPRGSVPLDRDFGVNWEVIDLPLNAVPAYYVADMARQIEKYVPRAEVVSVSFAAVSAARSVEEAALGLLRPVTVVRIRKEYADDFI